MENFSALNSCFVLGTNDLNANAAKIVDIYRKDQQGVERSFRFLKDPQYFADAFFLKQEPPAIGGRLEQLDHTTRS